MTTSITLRSTKGSALTHAEMDANLTNLQTTADAAKAASDTLTANKAEATALGVSNTDQNMGSFTGSTISDNVSAKAGIQALETAVETKATAAALGVTASAANMGTYTGSTISDNQTAKQNLQEIETAVEARPTSATLAASGGSALVGFIQSGAGATARTVQAKLREFVSVKDYGATGDGVTDDTAAVLAAITAHPKIFFPAGTYRLDASNSSGLRITSGSNYHFEGEGEDTIIKRHSYNPAKACIIFDSGSSSAFVTDIRFSNMKFLGEVATLGHNEVYGHFISLDGVKRVLIEKCYFEGPRSDALIFGTGAGGGTERHNHDVVVRDCVFDGVVNDTDGGRNAISFIDINGGTIDGCTFRNWSRNDMPGSICFEPDDSFGIVKNISIRGSHFSNCAGNRGHIAFSVVNIPSANFQNIRIIGNDFDSNKAISIYTDDTTPEVFPTTRQNIVIANNTGDNLTYFIEKSTGPIFGMTVTGNVLEGGTGLVNFGNGTADYTVKELIFANNVFRGSSTYNISISDDAEDVIFSNNVFGGATQASIILGVAASSTTRISITGNHFLGTPTNGMVQHSANTHNASTNLWANNVSAGLTHGFRAYRTDFPGSVTNEYGPSTTPVSFPYGLSVATWVSHSGPTGNDTGRVETNRYNSGAITRTDQIFRPEYSAGELAKTYYRRAIDNTTWSAWRTLTST